MTVDSTAADTRPIPAFRIAVNGTTIDDSRLSIYLRINNTAFTGCLTVLLEATSGDNIQVYNVRANGAATATTLTRGTESSIAIQRVL